MCSPATRYILKNTSIAHDVLDNEYHNGGTFLMSVHLLSCSDCPGYIQNTDTLQV